LGLVFYTGKSFPQRYHGGAFIGMHGSWNRSNLVGYKVAFVPFQNGKPSGAIEGSYVCFHGRIGFAAPYSSADSDAALLAFCQSTYNAAADLGGWDRASLECPLGRPRVPRVV